MGFGFILDLNICRNICGIITARNILLEPRVRDVQECLNISVELSRLGVCGVVLEHGHVCTGNSFYGDA